MSGLKEHNTVYKMIGTVLVPQEQNEARSNVDTRIAFIKQEM
jgi:prefoldin beta subunit